MLSGMLVSAHPRVGGENPAAQEAASLTRGSSPRGRGKHCFISIARRRDRLIPAWAGKTNRSFLAHSGAAAHPRVGGENVHSRATRACTQGSSPRGRGKLLHARDRPGFGRLIPAWAGKTIFVALYQNNETAHPRVGGENGVDFNEADVIGGSSPRGRGKHLV
mgnify:CR=1 FL=1